jgi:histone H3/H4
MAKLQKEGLKKILKEQGAEMISETGIQEFRRQVEAYAYRVAEVTVFAAKHAGRKKILASDVKLAVM